MQLGFVSAIVPELSLGEVFALAADEEYSYVEVCCWPAGKAERRFAGVTHIDVADLPQSRIDEIHGLSAKHRVGISALGYYPNPLDPDPAAARAAIDHLKHVIAAAQKLGLDTVNTFAGRDWTRSVDDNWPRFLETWKPLIAFAEDHRIRIGIENCPMFFTRDEWPGGKNLAYSPAIWRRMFNDIPSSNFGLNYDPSHLVWMRMDYEKPLREFRDRLHHLHAKDVRLFPDKLDEVGILACPLEYHQPRIPGFGEIDWARYLSVATEIGYTGPVCVEVEDDTFGRTLEGRKRAVSVAGQILKPYFPRPAKL